MGMFPLKWTNDVAIIDIPSIERAVHIIPKYDGANGSTKRLHAAWERDKMEHERGNVLNPELEKMQPKRLDPTNHFDELWLNNWTDISMYNTMY
jgi:hypothetical protein